MIQAVLFDLDGVIRHWDPARVHRIEVHGDLPIGALHRAAFRHDLLSKLVRGLINYEEWIATIEGVLVAEYGEAGKVAATAWAEDTGTIDGEMVALVRRLRQTVRVGLLSNASTQLEHDLEAHGITEAFDVVCNSARMGCAKPDEEIYRMAAHALGVPPECCLFIDDTPENVEGAAAVGMRAYGFAGVERLRAWLQEQEVDVGIVDSAQSRENFPGEASR